MNKFCTFNKLYEEVATFLKKDDKLAVNSNTDDIQEECCTTAGISVR